MYDVCVICVYDICMYEYTIDRQHDGYSQSLTYGYSMRNDKYILLFCLWIKFLSKESYLNKAYAMVRGINLKYVLSTFQEV